MFEMRSTTRFQNLFYEFDRFERQGNLLSESRSTFGKRHFLNGQHSHSKRYESAETQRHAETRQSFQSFSIRFRRTRKTLQSSFLFFSGNSSRFAIGFHCSRYESSTNVSTRPRKSFVDAQFSSFATGSKSRTFVLKTNRVSLQDILHAREEVRRAQKSLEEQQRREEDELFQKFRVDRELEEKKIEREVTDEWENKLRMLTCKYEDDLRRKKDKNIERVRSKIFAFETKEREIRSSFQELTMRFTKEKAELEQNMTLKRDKKREIVRRQLMEREQETTHSLVSKFSKEMINLIQKKEREVLVGIRKRTKFERVLRKMPHPFFVFVLFRKINGEFYSFFRSKKESMNVWRRRFFFQVNRRHRLSRHDDENVIFMKIRQYSRVSINKQSPWLKANKLLTQN